MLLELFRSRVNQDKVNTYPRLGRTQITGALSLTGRGRIVCVEYRRITAVDGKNTVCVAEYPSEQQERKLIAYGDLIHDRP